MAGLAQSWNRPSSNAKISLLSTYLRNNAVNMDLSASAERWSLSRSSLPWRDYSTPSRGRRLSAVCSCLIFLLVMVFHGCHVGGHDDDLLRAAYPNVCPLHGH